MDTSKLKQYLPRALKIAALVAMVCFFLPLCTVSCSGEEVEITGTRATFGIEAMGEKVDGNIFYALILLAPAVVLLLPLKEDISSALLFGGCAVVHLITLNSLKSGVEKQAQQMYATASTTGAFAVAYLAGLCILICAALWFWVIRQEGKNTAAAESRGDGDGSNTEQ